MFHVPSVCIVAARSVGHKAVHAEQGQQVLHLCLRKHLLKACTCVLCSMVCARLLHWFLKTTTYCQKKHLCSHVKGYKLNCGLDWMHVAVLRCNAVLKEKLRLHGTR